MSSLDSQNNTMSQKKSKAGRKPLHGAKMEAKSVYLTPERWRAIGGAKGAQKLLMK